MAVNQKIMDFNRVASQRDFSRDNLYRIALCKIGNILELDEKDLVYCKGAVLPSRENPSSVVKFHGMDFHYPMSTVKYQGGSYQLTFYVDARSILRDKFEIASRKIFNEVTTTGDFHVPGPQDVICLEQLNFNLEPLRHYHLHGVCLNKIDQVSTSFAEGEGKAIEINLTFTYNWYEVTDNDISKNALALNVDDNFRASYTRA